MRQGHPAAVPAAPAADMAFRDAREGDAAPIAAILQGWLDATPWMPDLHSLAETERFMGATLKGTARVRVAEAGGAPVGYLALGDDGCVRSLTLAEGWRGQGIGAHILDWAKAAMPGGLWLWTFEANTGAQRFYAREGFRETGRTAGDNAEGLPDIRLAWGTDP